MAEKGLLFVRCLASYHLSIVVSLRTSTFTRNPFFPRILFNLFQLSKNKDLCSYKFMAEFCIILHPIEMILQ